MLLTLLLHQPQALGGIVRATPVWVWALLAGLMLLGATQLRDRTAGLVRVAAMPVAMVVFSAWGTWSAFGRTSAGVAVIAAWVLVAAAVAALLALGRAQGSYDPARRQFHLPGTAVPMLLIGAIFLVKWCVGVEMALRPGVAADAAFAFPVAIVYGVFSGLFAGRTARLWKLVVPA
ncbi:DUF6622 family protein [Ramlibacter sp. MMS24-I3-19]|uniref:DUF6622 family protein n=1 Tax=Ramlibacter sp. MMS24-I3-19 TaxID=3416606 RepID=UPI003CFEAC7C